MDKTGFLQACPSCEGGDGGGGDPTGCGPLFHPDTAVGRLFIRDKNGTTTQKCTAVLITPQYFLTPARCVGSVAVAAAPQGSEWTWASTNSGTSWLEQNSAAVDRIFSLGGAPGHNTNGSFDLALGRLKWPVPNAMPPANGRGSPDIQPAEIGAYPAQNGQSMSIIGHGVTFFPSCRDQIYGPRKFQWPHVGDDNPSDPGSAVFPWDGNTLLYMGSGGGKGWIDVWKFREQIFGTIRSLDMGFERGVDRLGADLPEGMLQLTSVNECRQACEENRSSSVSFNGPCASFSFVPQTSACYLKGAIPDPVPNAGVISGLPRTMSMFSLPGENMDIKMTSTAVECQQACGADTACQSFTFLDGSCELKRAIPPASECASCLSGSYRAELSYDRSGGDLRSLNTTKSLECVSECAKDKECRAWTFGVPRYGGPGVCWLKGRAATPVYNTNHPDFFPFVSGLRRGIDYNVDRPGRDYKNLEVEAPEPELCQTKCEQDAQCKAWAMTLSPTGRGNHCWLKNGIPAQVMDRPGIVSGVKGDFKF